MGIVENLEQLHAISEALPQIGIKEFKVLSGAQGIRFLNREEDTVADFVLGDMEPKMIQRYHSAVEKGLLVFIAAVESDKADEVAMACKARGASQVVHFGEWVITNY
jgi:hypothetical protein